MKTTWTWEGYLQLLRELADTLEQLTAVERRKTEAVCSGNLTVVDECMKKEQAFSLSLRGFDQKREQALGQLGLTGVSLRDLEAHSPEDLLLETRRTAELLRQKYELVQTASQVARNTLECNLHEIEKQIEARVSAPKPAPKNDGQPKKTDFRA